MTEWIFKSIKFKNYDFFTYNDLNNEFFIKNI